MNECIPFESEEEENVGSELETVAAELNGLSERKLPELETLRVRVAIRRSSARVLAAEADGGIGKMDVRENKER